MQELIRLEETYGAKNYAPLPVVLTRGEGVYLWDIDGKKYIDMMSAYSAVSHGHCNPGLIKALTGQVNTLSVISRAYYSDKLAPFLQKLCEVTGFEQGLPMNTGAEAVETALKVARKWGYTKKLIPEDKAEIIVCNGNFHGRTIAVVAMSTEEQYKAGFGPFPKGFVTIPFGDASALEDAITPNTCAFLVEPIQGENGIIVPPAGYLKQCAEICKKHNVLLICDEIQTGVGRTGKFLASEHDGVMPDGVLLGKALGGGILPVSVFLTRKNIMDVITPGDHGSTFGGNPLSSVVGQAAVELLFKDNLIENSATLGEYLMQLLRQIDSEIVDDVRGKGLMVGLAINPAYASAKEFCLRLMHKGVLSKDTHETVVRLAPPLIINKEQIDTVFRAIAETIKELETELSISK